MVHSWFGTPKVVTMTIHYPVSAIRSIDFRIWTQPLNNLLKINFHFHMSSSWWWHGQTLSHSSIGRGWIFHSTSHNIQVILIFFLFCYSFSSIFNWKSFCCVSNLELCKSWLNIIQKIPMDYVLISDWPVYR